MLTLYHKPTCPYCKIVLRVASELNVDLNLLDITLDQITAAELIKRGGKRQVPYLVDSERGVEMYESADIIDHLKKYYVH